MANNYYDIPYSDRASNNYVRNARKNYADLNGIDREIRNYVNFCMREFIKGVHAQCVGEEAEIVRVFAELTRQGIVRNYESRIKTVHKEAGEKALGVIVAAYKNRPHQRRIGSYRENDAHYRDSGRKLENALGDNRMFRVAYDGIDFIDPNWLDSQARQWYRLNFGAGAAGGGKGRAARMTMFGKSVGQVSLNNFKKSSAFTIPYGFWMAGGRIEQWGASKQGGFFMAPPPFGKNPYAKGLVTYGVVNRERLIKGAQTAKGRETLGRHGFAERDIRRLHEAGPARDVSNLREFMHTSKGETKGIQANHFLDEGVYELAKILPIAYSNLYKEWFETYNRSKRRGEKEGPLAHRYIQEQFTQDQIRRAGVKVNASVKEKNFQRRRRAATGNFRQGNYAHRVYDNNKGPFSSPQDL